MTSKTFWYRVIDLYETSLYILNLPYSYDVTRQAEQTKIAKKCAEDYHSNHDGWEDTWPLIFAIHADENGPEVARLEVDRAAVPEFYVRHIVEIYAPDDGTKQI